MAKHSGYAVGPAELAAEFDPSSEVRSEAPNGKGSVEIARARLQADTSFNLDDAMQEQELAYLDAALGLTEGNISRAAKLLGLSRSTLYSRLEVAGRLPDRAGDKLVE